jgi:hypothetical protein
MTVRQVRPGSGSPPGNVDGVERSRSAPELVVVGCPSMDRLVGAGGEDGAPGGSGFNTALASRASGIDVGLVAAIPTHLPRQIGTGCVEIIDDDLRHRVASRAWVDEAEEAEIRGACFEAIASLVDASGLTQAAVDGFFFANARRVCVEAGPPRCDECVARDVCATRIELFQPVIRTTAY